MDDARYETEALKRLFACWILLSGALIEFYARRYGYPAVAMFPQGVLAIVAIVALLTPGKAFTRFFPRSPGAPALPYAIVLVAALVFALGHRFQLVHVGAVSLLLIVALFLLWPTLLLRTSRQVWRPAISLWLGTLNFLLIVYYVVLIVGRETWNQIVSRELLLTYFFQVPDLIFSLPIAPWIPWTIAGCTFLGLLLVYWFAAPGIARGVVAAGERFRRALLPAPAAPRTKAVALWVAAGAMAVSGQWLYRTAAYGDTPDPLLTTLFVNQDRPGSPHMPFVSDPALDALDREVARRYGSRGHLERKTLVLITVDALRADQMNVYGHARPNTPFLSRLHREGKLARFDNAFSVCTESLCGLLGIHASRYWHQLGTRNFGLGDALKRLGYRNHFLLGGDHSSFYGLRAFYGVSIDEYRDGADARGYVNDDAQVLRWLENLDVTTSEPRFVYIHLMSTHLLGKRLTQYRVWYKTGAGGDQADYFNKYHDGILQADGMIEETFRILERKGLLRRAVVAITSDHGEMLGEHRQTGHGGQPFDQAVRVPLLIYDTDAYRYPSRALASVIDIAPTLLDRIGAPIPENWAGVSLARVAERDFAIMQAGRTHAIVGRFRGQLYKYYYHADKRTEQLVRLSGDGVEQPVALPKTKGDVLVALRAEFDRQRPAMRQTAGPSRDRIAVQ